LPVTAQAGFSQLINDGELMLHQNALQALQITDLEEQLAVMTKTKARKRKRLQHGGTQEYGEAAVATERAKKARSSGDQERAQPALWRCENCGGTGHNAQTCKNI
jgi:hypothetical protein